MLYIHIKWGENVHTSIIKNSLLDVRIVCVISEVVFSQERVLHLNTPAGHTVHNIHVHLEDAQQQTKKFNNNNLPLLQGLQHVLFDFK